MQLNNHLYAQLYFGVPLLFTSFYCACQHQLEIYNVAVLVQSYLVTLDSGTCKLSPNMNCLRAINWMNSMVSDYGSRFLLRKIRGVLASPSTLIAFCLLALKQEITEIQPQAGGVAHV